MPKPALLFAEQSTIALQRGFDQIAELLAVTLGPTQGNILNAQEAASPELLTDSATIARRILELPDRATNVGAMLMRNIAWRVNLRAGDGVATTAVLAQAILREAFRYVQAGGNAMLLKRGIDRATQLALAELTALARPVSGEEELTRVAETITAEPELSLVLGEMFDVLGPEAHITIENYVAPYLERAYYDGGRWKARLASPYFITDRAGQRAIQNDCQVVLFAGALRTLADVQPMLELLATLEKKRCLLVAHDISGQALSTLVANHQQERFQVVAVALHRPAGPRAADFADLAVITGATVLEENLGQSLSGLEAEELGHLRRAEAGAESLVISGGGGDPAARRGQIQQLQARLARLPETDREEREELRLRLARLSGGVGVLKIGTHTKAERDALHQKAQKGIRSLRLAMAEGVVPGGGVGYLQLIPALERLADSLADEQRQGALILAAALAKPFRRIVHNGGAIEPAAALARIHRRETPHVYDVIRNRPVPQAEMALLDPAGVLRIALETAVSGAMLALTTGAIVLHRRPEQSLEP